MAIYSERNSHRMAVCIATLITLLFATVAISLTGTAFTQHQERQIIKSEFAHLSLLGQAFRQFKELQYDACLRTVEAIPINSVYVVEKRSIKVDCQIGVAEKKLQLVQQIREKGFHIEVMEKLIQVAREEPNSPKIEHLFQNLAREILSLAKNVYYRPDNGFEEAIHLLNQIESDNTFYDDAQALLRNWQSEWFSNQQYWQVAHDHRNVGNLTLARQTAEQISLHPFWAPIRREFLWSVGAYEPTCNG